MANSAVKANPTDIRKLHILRARRSPEPFEESGEIPLKNHTC